MNTAHATPPRTPGAVPLSQRASEPASEGQGSLSLRPIGRVEMHGHYAWVMCVGGVRPRVY
eukprot:COSAG01_NODE_5289_length_4353_cov_4.408461_2_plen_61_part_00